MSAARSSAYAFMSLPSQGWLDLSWPLRSWAIAGWLFEAMKSSCSSQESALSGQPWLKTTGRPAPQSYRRAGRRASW
jgi:hypothetical protein